MTLIHAIILGCVEGLTEFLPVSSTAHLLLAASLLRLEQTAFLKTFEIAIQSGAMFAVIAVYGKDLFLRSAIWLRVLVAFVPTAVLGLLLHDVVKNLFFESTPLILWSLGIGGVVLIAFDFFFREKPDAAPEITALPYWKAAAIGACQALALVPGVSRAAATIVGGLLLGASRGAIVPFSFLLAVPTILAATALDLFQYEGGMSAADGYLLLVGTIVSFAVALATIRLLTRYFSRGSLAIFGVYRICIALLFASLL